MALVVPLVVVSCQDKAKRLEPVPQELQPRVALANAAIADLKTTLSGRLLDTIQKQGPKAGIEVCSAEAEQLTKDVASRHGVEVGRTSARLRNAKANAPRPWLESYVREVSSLKAKDAKPAAFDLGDKIGVAQPLGAQAQCLTCHGDPAGIPADVSAVLGERYPGDRATGYAEGDVRGVVWAEIPKK